jgi:hypothetical protein
VRPPDAHVGSIGVSAVGCAEKIGNRSSSVVGECLRGRQGDARTRRSPEGARFSGIDANRRHGSGALGSAGGADERFRALVNVVNPYRQPLAAVPIEWRERCQSWPGRCRAVYTLHFLKRGRHGYPDTAGLPDCYVAAGVLFARWVPLRCCLRAPRGRRCPPCDAGTADEDKNDQFCFRFIVKTIPCPTPDAFPRNSQCAARACTPQANNRLRELVRSRLQCWRRVHGSRTWLRLFAAGLAALQAPHMRALARESPT